MRGSKPNPEGSRPYAIAASPLSDATIRPAVIVAAQLEGTGVQLQDPTLGGGNHFSLEEAYWDLTLGAQSAVGQCAVPGGGWADQQPRPLPGASVRPFDPSTWSALAIFGTSYDTLLPDALYE